MSNIDKDIEHCIKVEMQTLYPEEYERIYGNLDKPNPNAMEKKMPKIHHSNVEMQKLFEDYSVRVSEWKKLGIDRDLPAINCLKNGNYAIWSGGCTCNQSAWNEHKTIKGEGWSDPFEIHAEDRKNCLYYNEHFWNNYNSKDLKKNPKTRVLEGNYAGFHSWWSNNYGHTMHDSLPLLAYLKTKVDDSFKFLMINAPVLKKIIKALDPDFCNRIEWIEIGEVINVTGNLVIPTPDYYPCIMAKNLMSYFLDWASISLPKPVERNNIIFYTRNKTTPYRVLNLENEKNVIECLKKFLTDNKIDSNLIIFSGKDENGNVLPVDEQISIFRSAHTIIGPHGTGLTNIMWCDFSNDSPIKLLEFNPGPKGYSSQVQEPFNGYHTVFRGLPMDYNIILYEPHSTAQETFINLEDFNMAINKMFLNE